MSDRTLILGGARSGKSLAAERLLSAVPDVLYVATGGDDSGSSEWAARVAKHQSRRPASWGLVETIDLVPLLSAAGPPLLIDCLTLWLSRTMDSLDIWSDLDRFGLVEDRIAALTTAWSTTGRRVVAVSNDIGAGVVPADPGTRLFRDLMGRLNTGISLASDQALYTIAGRTLPLT
ncbi:bifunctional adenosylcobinamide kinase/adenosylcobinamide-phosphate guanylyltransferase [Kribbella antibiotica]|uniref:Adenosylcobinamide kinase n=1 Tax=Kribbella antibiotica TaxID=190195 RepID=A0A4R4ZUL7_9ACTN|nr:bifunctional adenosylcobinamide kinase/adenosylcobinamide-phosphate guanylyltransferase [Kribbella antibiotica]TDD60772.1 bifunctional adenosylcobinamide kinase/adenosylcobinamide-phosphate guanylyltransferase [Kribbella antibiotica]